MKTGNRSNNPKPRRRTVPPQSVLDWTGILRPQSFFFYIVLVAVLGTGLSVVRTTHDNRIAFNELQELREQANQFDVMWGQLLLEQSTFGVEGRIEQKALEQLHMQVPDISSIVMVRND